MIKRISKLVSGDPPPATRQQQAARRGTNHRQPLKRGSAEVSDEDSEEDSEGSGGDGSEEVEGLGEGGELMNAPPLAPGAPTIYPSVVRRATHKKKKVLVLCSRGVTNSYKEVMEDMLRLLPHSRKDHKFDKKDALTSIVEIAEMRGCHLALYLECRKMQDLYLWAGRVHGGPSAKFLVEQVRPMRDLRLTGNCLLGSRPVLSFDGEFDAVPHLKVIKQLLASVFAPPQGHPRSKPFHDHVLSFSLLDGRVLVRHYQMVPSDADRKSKAEGDTLVEIGPRFALVPIRLLAGCFAGATLFSNDAYVSPNSARADLKRKRARTTVGAVAQKETRRKRIQQEGVDLMPEDEFADVFATG